MEERGSSTLPFSEARVMEQAAPEEQETLEKMKLVKKYTKKYSEKYSGKCSGLWVGLSGASGK